MINLDMRDRQLCIPPGQEPRVRIISIVEPEVWHNESIVIFFPCAQDVLGLKLNAGARWWCWYLCGDGSQLLMDDILEVRNLVGRGSGAICNTCCSLQQ